MKKIGIVTLGDYDNYGNRLQNVALSVFLESNFNVQAMTILNEQNEFSRTQLKNLHDLLRIVLRINVNYHLFKERTRNFKEFSRKYTKEVSLKNSSKFGIWEDVDCDFVIVGSDQVWNFNWQTSAESEYFMLKGIPDHKRVSYAESMGNPPIPSDYEAVFKHELSKFSAVSVRERAAQKYISEEFGTATQLVPDPTLLITADEWKNLLNFSLMKGNFVFTYFLSKPEPDIDKLIEEYCEVHHLRRINFQSLTKADRRYYKSGPEKFVENIANAKYVFTDSFHASAFATIFSVPFIVDTRRGAGTMSTRMETLFEVAGIPDRSFKSTMKV